MKITDQLIRAAVEQAPPPPTAVELEYESPVAAFLAAQDPMDVLRYVNSRKPVDEFYLETAMETLAQCADMEEAFLDADIGAFPEIWAEIERRVRRQSRGKKRAANTQTGGA